MPCKAEWGKIKKQWAGFLDKILILLDGYYQWIIYIYGKKEQQER